MKLTPACYHCLQRLIGQAAHLATGDELLRQRAVDEATKILEREFSYDRLSIAIAAGIHRIVKEVTGNPDPYRAMKDREMALAGELYPELSSRVPAARSGPRGSRGKPSVDGVRESLELAAAANAIDFFRELDCIREDIRRPVSFAIDDSEQLLTKLSKADKVLYLADNAGEIYFDLPLIKRMEEFARVTYVVKPEPVQDDLTVEDVREAGLEGEFGKVMSTGVASPGVVFALASADLRREFESADLIFAKGMGHYEALSELPREGRIFYCLRAKCQPVADSLGVLLNSYVAMLQ
jgi:damage-control phosphatase, subfamily I